MGWLEVSLSYACRSRSRWLFPFWRMLSGIFRAYVWIAKSIPFSFFNGFRLENLIGIGNDGLVCDREADGLSVSTGMFIWNEIGRGISFSFVRILFRM